MQAAMAETDNVKQMMAEMGAYARAAATELASASEAQKNNALRAGAEALLAHKKAIKDANALDMAFAREKGLSAAMLDRLALDDARIEAMAEGLRSIAELTDPVGHSLKEWDRPNGLKMQRVSVPLGVIGIIYESRPNVTADAGALCLKSGNAVILRGGSESLHSSAAIVDALHDGLRAAGITVDAIQLIPTRDRNAVGEMLRMSGIIDVIIPRGGLGLTKRVAEESRVPTLLHLDGNCHTYVHKSADIQMALDVIKNAKLRRTGICGATESLVIDVTLAPEILPKLADMLLAEGCEIRGGVKACSLEPRLNPADESDWAEEYLDKIISVKLVDGLEQAITHVNRYSSHHTDAIIASDEDAAAEYLARIDSAIVMHNTSTQFADGGEFGFGAEIGIATGRLHARGPVGVDQLVTYKYVVRGDGHIRA